MAGEESMAQDEIPKKTKNDESKILKSFSDIIKDDPKLRAKSGATLIRELVQKNGGVKETELKYVLKRLIRGLGAQRNTSRVGFFTVFSSLLQTPRIECDIEDVLKLLEDELHTSKNSARSENSDVRTGHVLVCGSILRSGQFKSVNLEQQKNIISMLINAGKKTSYLSLPSHVFIVDMIGTLTSNEFEKSVFSVMKAELTKPLKDYTLDNLYFLIEAHNKFPSVVNGKFFKEATGRSDFINEDSVGDIANILLSVIPTTHVLKHPVYELAAKKISETKHIPGFLDKINEALQRPTQTRLHGSSILLTTLVKNTSDPSLLPQIYTRNYLVEILNHLKSLNSKNQDEVQKAAYELFNATVAAIKEENVKTKHKIALLKRLLFFPGTFIFEKLTRSKVIQQIVATLNDDGVKKLCKVYQDVMLSEVVKQKNEETTETWLNLDRVYASQLIVKLLNHPAVKGEVEWKKEQLTVLMDVALFKDEKNKGIGIELAAALKETFYHGLDLKMSKLEDLRSILSHLAHHMNNQLTSKNYKTIMRNPFNESSYSLWCKTMAEIDKFESTKKKKDLCPVFHTLFLSLIFQIVNNPKLASDSLNELFACYEKAKSKNSMEGEEEIAWIEVVVDLFLNLLSHNSHLLRNLINRVFPYLCKDLNANALHQILSVLDPQSSDNPLSLRGAEESDDEEDEEENEDDEDNENDEENEDEENEDSVDEEESSDDEEVEEETVNDKLRQAVRMALGKGAETDEESVDMDAMSDSECEKLNTALGEAFKKFKPNLGKKSRKQSKDEETLTHFRIRVLDLIDLYLESPDVSMIYCLEIMLPLLQTLEFSVKENHQSPLQNRIRYCLKKLLGVKKFASVDGVNETVLQDLLNSLLEKGTKTALLIQEIGDKISECCIFTIRCTQYLSNQDDIPKKTKKKLTSGIIDILLEAQNMFFEKRDCLLPYVLFKSVVGMVWEKITDLLPNLVKHAFNDEVRPFRQRQALELITLFYKNQRLFKAHETTIAKELVQVEESLQENIINFLSNPEPIIKENFISYLFTLLTTIRNSPVKTGTIDWEQIKISLTNFAKCVIFKKEVKIAFNKLCSSLNISSAITTNKDAIKLNAVRDVEEKQAGGKKKKLKGNAQQKKLKKQADLLRMQSLSEGFGDDVTFANVNMSAKRKVHQRDKSNGIVENGVEEDEEMDVGMANGEVKVNGKRSREGEVSKQKKFKRK